MSKVPMSKMSGAGNTFVLIDAREGFPFRNQEKKAALNRRKLTQRVCDMTQGVAADGVVFIENGSEGFDFNWDFYNNDGSSAEMCGNAARCAASFVADRLAVKKPTVKFKTGAGPVSTEKLADGRIRVLMPPLTVNQSHYELKTHTGVSEVFFFVNTGVPHLVQKIHEISDTENMKDMAREIRFHPDLGTAGSNVTFYVEDRPGFINAITYERGVEDYTLACGTGAVAAAKAHASESRLEHIQVKMPGGLLEVDFFNNDPHPRMTGEAVVIADFDYDIEVLNEEF